ncbi:MAG TPA: hypothetical protein VJA26_03815, partial [Gammaproteobacteria bacterium]|nr:hypothetical protein [Gammaproteobacteria bacterium]
LAGRKAQQLIGRILDRLKSSAEGPEHIRGEYSLANLLGQCILDEIQIPPALVTESLEAIARHNYETNVIIPLFRSRHGDELARVIRDAYSTEQESPSSLGGALATITTESLGFNR